MSKVIILEKYSILLKNGPPCRKNQMAVICHICNNNHRVIKLLKFFHVEATIAVRGHSKTMLGKGNRICQFFITLTPAPTKLYHMIYYRSDKKYPCLKVAFIQKGLMRFSFLQTNEPNYFPELEFVLLFNS